MSNAASRQRIQDEPAFVLHSYPFRETSLIVEAFSRNHGRVPLVARGARRPRAALRGLLMSFQPLAFSWFGKHELRTLHGAEWQGGQPQLQGTALLCGFYLNELLLNLMARDDPHEGLFDYYQLTLQRLAQESDHAFTLRCFEKHLFQELGYALTLHTEAGSGKPVEADRMYRYILERGAVAATADSTQGMVVAGKTLLDMEADDYRDADTARQSKLLMRMLLDHHLAGKTLHTRELMRDLQKL
ncbi:MAG: DNA repair protein RecO [Gallionella sp.]|nr:DNA repair protein RecO [Gallionella sp.]OIO12359.1 MAG: DNA repair protein RecO [Gallionellaceae bacterium CG1_02_60_325]PIR09031.1 MAG: DNA repair protein RecO [Gallionellaceae bacterium CG11_big_fil_rev_8_21_14_0_20_60_62]PIV47806.1 MAG: DNA repair protein RecO [Gallionellaceae bacterium CG02_land_8_20_14_3_00_60_115]PJC05102.1 MAG: DNA repair protein RecO [Gallionellaceae bacterium CG_4_9_14_0_8_um_filter_60_335]